MMMMMKVVAIVIKIAMIITDRCNSSSTNKNRINLTTSRKQMNKGNASGVHGVARRRGREKFWESARARENLPVPPLPPPPPASHVRTLSWAGEGGAVMQLHLATLQAGMIFV